MSSSAGSALKLKVSLYTGLAEPSTAEVFLHLTNLLWFIRDTLTNTPKGQCRWWAGLGGGRQGPASGLWEVWLGGHTPTLGTRPLLLQPEGINYKRKQGQLVYGLTPEEILGSLPFPSSVPPECIMAPLALASQSLTGSLELLKHLLLQRLKVLGVGLT